MRKQHKRTKLSSLMDYLTVSASSNIFFLLCHLCFHINTCKFVKSHAGVLHMRTHVYWTSDDALLVITDLLRDILKGECLLISSVTLVSCDCCGAFYCPDNTLLWRSYQTRRKIL